MFTKVYLADTHKLRDEAYYHDLYEALPLFRQEKADSLRLTPDKIRSVAAWTLLEKALAAENIRPANGRFTREDFVIPEFGRPELKDHPDIHFNISHSGTKVMCSVSDTLTGCDVEKMPQRYETERIAKRFYSSLEYNYIHEAASDEEKKELFYRIWTLKESYIKTTGAGLALPYKTFSVDPTSPETQKKLTPPAVSAMIQYTGVKGETIFCRSYDCIDGYAYGCCSLSGHFTDIIHIEL